MNAAFHVGDRVRIPFMQGNVTGVIAEDRGPFGIQGQRIFRILIDSDPDEPDPWMLTESQIEAIPAGSDAEGQPSLATILNYLKQGGLIAILQANLAGGRSQPQAWLRLDSLGNVTHTFGAGRGLTGGAVVPFMATEAGRIFEPKVAEVTQFLKSFGLNDVQAANVIQAVGTWPG